MGSTAFRTRLSALTIFNDGRQALRLSGASPPRELVVLLRAMNSYYSNRIEGQHTLPIDIERALRNDYAAKAHRQGLAPAHMQTDAAIESHWKDWSDGEVWSARSRPC